MVKMRKIRQYTKRRIQRILSAVLSLSVLLSCITVPTVIAEGEEESDSGYGVEYNLAVQGGASGDTSAYKGEFARVSLFWAPKNPEGEPSQPSLMWGDVGTKQIGTTIDITNTVYTEVKNNVKKYSNFSNNRHFNEGGYFIFIVNHRANNTIF